MTKQILQCCIAIFAIISVTGCNSGGDSGAPEKSALWQDTLQNVARVLWMPEYDAQQIPAQIRQNLDGPKISPKAVGQGTQAFLDDLIQNPDSCSPDVSERLELFKKHSDELNPHQAYAMRNLFGKDTSRGYRQTPPAISFKFPADDAPQNQFQVGWHFFVGSAYSESGEEFGVQMMFWHYALLPPAMAHKAGLTDMENQVMEMHLAISRAGDRHYRSQPYIVSGTTGLTHFSAAPFDYKLGKNRMLSRHADTLFPIDLTAWGLDERDKTPVEIALNMGLVQSAGKGYVLNGDQGLSPSCGGVGTLYYSVPNLRIDPDVSWIQLGDEKIRLASGKLWYDHQYGTGMMPSGNPRTSALRAFSNINATLKGEDPGGWDWLMFQFDDNTEMSLAALHTLKNKAFYEQTGTAAPGTMQADATGLFIRTDGSYRPVDGSIEVSDWIKSDISYGPYLASHTWYPNRVKVAVNSAEIATREFYMVPIVTSGQQGYFANGLQYSEGAVYLEDMNGNRIGRGFLESTGYADGVPQILALSGMPADAKTLELMKPKTLNEAQVLSCGAYLLEPQVQAQLAEEIAQCKGVF